MSQKKLTESELQRYTIDFREAHFRFAYSYAKNVEDAWDIVQESILKALSAIKRGMVPEHLNSWFYRILVNASLDHLKRHKRYVPFDLDDTSPLLEFQDVHSDLDLHHALDRIPTEIRTIVTLRYFEDFKISEIADILSLNENTVKTRLYRGLSLLRIELEEK